MLPVVNAFALTDSGDCVVAVDQFQVCAKFKLSMVFVAVAAESEDRAGVAEIVAQLVFVPSVVKNLPELLVCAGAKALNAAVAVVAPVPP